MAETLVGSSGTPFDLFSVSTTQNVTVNLGDNDVLLLHTGVSAGTTPSTAGDYITVMNAFASDGTTGNTMVASYAAGAKLNIPSGAGFAFRGFDCSLGSLAGLRAVIIRAVGHDAMVQAVKGSQFGSHQ